MLLNIIVLGVLRGGRFGSLLIDDVHHIFVSLDVNRLVKGA